MLAYPLSLVSECLLLIYFLAPISPLVKNRVHEPITDICKWTASPPFPSSLPSLSLPLFSSLPFPLPCAVVWLLFSLLSAEALSPAWPATRLRSVAARMLSVAHRPVLSVTARPRSVAARLRSMMFSMAPCLRAATRLRPVAARLRSM